MHLNEAPSSWEVASLLMKSNSLTLSRNWRDRRGPVVENVIRGKSVWCGTLKGRNTERVAQNICYSNRHKMRVL